MSSELHSIVQAYDTKFSGDGFSNPASYYRWILKLLKLNRKSRLLDIACGKGDLLHFACQQTSACFGVDLSSVAIQIARRRAPSAHIMEGNAEILPFADGSFDCVTILGSLEHLINPGRGLLEIRRVLDNKGTVIIDVPNGYYLPDLVWQVWHSGYGPNHKQVVERFAAVNEWRAFIESGGFNVKRICYFTYHLPASRADWAWFRKHPRRWLDVAAAPFIPRNLSKSFVYICTKDTSCPQAGFVPPDWPIPPRLVDLGR